MTPDKLAGAGESVRPGQRATASVRLTRARSVGTPTVAIVCVALLAAGCGNSHRRFNATTAMSHALRFVACMRSHGVPDMPDPQVFHNAGKTGVVISDPNSATTAARFKSAEHACQPLQSLPVASNAPQSASARAQRQKQALAFAVCMRSHGAPNFPDPNDQGQFTSKLYASTPQVQAANKTCQNTLPAGADPLSGGEVPAA
jgi:hypothetical protein